MKFLGDAKLSTPGLPLLPTLPSSAHEEWRPSVLVELRAPEVDEKKLRNEPNHGAGILAKLAWSDAERYGCRGEVSGRRRSGARDGPRPAWRGQPGYYPQHDDDRDGIACEPWSRP
jgi:Excalibur calcium-binding domain